MGKTATASQRAAAFFQLDDPDQLAIAEADVDRLLEGPAPVLIDEWQYVPPVWDNVRRAVDDGAAPGAVLADWLSLGHKVTLQALPEAA